MDKQQKIILDLCAGTGSWSKPYQEHPEIYDVRLVTLPERDIRTYIPPDNVYGILAAPPCTMFSYARTVARAPRDVVGAMEIVSACLKIIWEVQYSIKTGEKKTPLKFWALENPSYGILKHFLGRATFEFDPFDFEDEYQKRTSLWGYFNNPQKKPVKLTTKQRNLAKTNLQPLAKYIKFDKLKTREIHPELYKTLTRRQRRGITPPGFAQAFFESNP